MVPATTVGFGRHQWWKLDYFRVYFYATKSLLLNVSWMDLVNSAIFYQVSLAEQVLFS